MAKFLVDTSVWIDFFKGDLRQNIRENLCEGMRLGLVAIADIIRHEILVGARNREQFRELKTLLSPLECLRMEEKEVPLFDEFAWELSQKGLRGKYTDAAISYLAMRYHLPLLTFDRYFFRLADKGMIQVIRY